MTDRERLIEWIEESRWIEFQRNILTAPARRIADYLISKEVTIPVRCRECDKEQECKQAQYLGENGFCSYGERKEE